jgi:hypothetical protein
MLKGLCRLLGINPLDRTLKRAAREGGKRILVCWNRGLGDIPLGLYALVVRIRQFIPDAEISFLTRVDLEKGFLLLGGGEVLVDPTWKRGVPFDVAASLKRVGKRPEAFDCILEQIDPTNWLSWQIGKLVPRLQWQKEWDALFPSFGLSEEGPYIGVHVQTETHYSYEKNWPKEYWEEFFKRVTQEHNAKVVLFGFAQEPSFDLEGVIDLRGKTDLFQMLSIIKNRCTHLVVPDSGVLSLTYYIDSSFPLKIVSLWADPAQGILRQKVPSPNPELTHIALIGENKDLRRVPVDSVVNTLFSSEEKWAIRF